MVKVSKSEVEYLIKNGYLKRTRGQCLDLTICSKRKRANGKQRYIPDYIAEKLNDRQVGSN